MIKKELELFYGVYKDTCLKAVEGSYNKETKTIKTKVKAYAVEYDELNRRRKFNNKIDELSDVIPPIEWEICIGGLEVEEKYFLYESTNKNKTTINVEECKYFVYVPVELIDKFLELEQGKFQKIYAIGTDFDEPTFIEI